MKVEQQAKLAGTTVPFQTHVQITCRRAEQHHERAGSQRRRSTLTQALGTSSNAQRRPIVGSASIGIWEADHANALYPVNRRLTAARASTSSAS